MSTKTPTGEDVAGFHLDIAPGGQSVFGGIPLPPMITMRDGADCDLYMTAQDARDLASSLVRAADVLDAHLAKEAK